MSKQDFLCIAEHLTKYLMEEAEKDTSEIAQKRVFECRNLLTSILAYYSMTDKLKVHTMQSVCDRINAMFADRENAGYHTNLKLH